MFKSNEINGELELIYDVDNVGDIDSVSLGILKNNDISCFFPIQIVTQDGSISLKYSVGKAQKLSDYLNAELTKADLLSVFEKTAIAFKIIGEYMLAPEQVLMNKDYIYLDNDAVKIILLPLNGIHNKTNICTFFKNLLLDMMALNEEASIFAVDMTKGLSLTESFSIEEFIELIKKLKLKKYSDKPHGKEAGKNVAKSRRINKSTSADSLNTNTSYSYNNYAGMAANGINPVNIANPVQNYNYYTGNQMPNNTMNQAILNTPSENRTQNEKKKKKSFLGFGKEKKSAVEVTEDKTAFSAPVNKGFSAPANKGFLIPGSDKPINVNTAPVKEKKRFSLFGKKKIEDVKVDNVSVNQSSIPPAFNTYNAAAGETTILQNFYAGGETTLLGVQPTGIRNAFLTWRRTGENINITTPVFKIGREKSYVNFCITDNTSVGRNHAEIILKDGIYFIKDENSLNFTMINGERVEPFSEVELFDNDTILIADEEFEFHIG